MGNATWYQVQNLKGRLPFFVLLLIQPIALKCSRGYHTQGLPSSLDELGGRTLNPLSSISRFGTGHTPRTVNGPCSKSRFHLIQS
jgi:hypothetical protein